MSRNCFSWSKDEQNEHKDLHLQNIFTDNAQQQQDKQKPIHIDKIKTQSIKEPVEKPPFHVVLVDIKKAADERKIHCVKKPLVQSDLIFVALSYRWGELEETMVNTGVGYVATITSFDLNHFFHLCRAITQEVDLQHMQYVWVDTICVNQTDDDERKATIYHMTDIYERANYILAVPDLHLGYLWKSTTNFQIFNNSNRYNDYLYYLIHGNMEKLVECDQKFLDDNGVPNDRYLRHLLQNYTDYFTNGLTTCRKDERRFNNHAALYHIYETNTTSCTQSSKQNGKKATTATAVTDDDDDTIDTLGINELHTCDDVDLCPLVVFHGRETLLPDQSPEDFIGANYQTWKHLIVERSQAIRQIMVLLEDLVRDWSTRAWVISEFHLAKKKNNKMKYWFIKFSLSYFENSFPDGENSFFTFDFVGNDCSTSLLCGYDTNGGDDNNTSLCVATGRSTHTSNAVYQLFHTTMRQQLSQQTFLEKVLKSNASRHEDRFHAILPSSEYKSVLTNKDLVDQWNIRTLLDVKLQLYDWMTTKHKFELLLLSAGNMSMRTPLPTFASTNMFWPDKDYYLRLIDIIHSSDNFDLTDPSTIQLIQRNQVGNGRYKLAIKPREYLRLVNDKNKRCLLSLSSDDDDTTVLTTTLLLLEEGGKITVDQLDVIVIPTMTIQALKKRRESIENWWDLYELVVLLGCPVKNAWVFHPCSGGTTYFFTRFLAEENNDDGWEFYQCDENSIGFDIY